MGWSLETCCVVKVYLHPDSATASQQALALSPSDPAAWMKTFKCRVRHLRCGRFFNPRWGFDWHAGLPSLVLPVVYFTQFPLVHEVHSQGVATQFGGKQKEWPHEKWVEVEKLPMN